ncbi:MAG: thioredoxin family protein [Pseudanabaenaceae cyanobacterium]
MSAIQIEILGTGCKKCQQLEANAKEAIAALNLEAEIVHITDPIAIAQRGVMSTPALRINNRLVGKGKVLSPDEIQAHLRG